ncbi:MAG: BACON domain-containing protein [Rikenellaceae bacterium]|nr:BACON domain-containing protein [Rikenellaceae bacterium]
MKPTPKGNQKKREWALAALLLPALLFTACNPDDKPSGDPEFRFETGISGITVAAVDTEAKFVIRSNRDWEFQADGEEYWLTIFPAVGSDDGIIKVSFTENTLFEDRSAFFQVLVHGQPHADTLLRITQRSVIPQLSFPKVSEGRLKASKWGNTLAVEISANVDWVAAIEPSGPGESFDWVTVDAEQTAPSSLVIRVEEVPEGMEEEQERSVIVRLTAPDFPQVDTCFTIYQVNSPPVEGLPQTWTLTLLGSEQERAELWLSEQKIYPDDTEQAWIQWVKGPNPGVDEIETSYDVSNSDPRVSCGREGDAWMIVVPVKNGNENQPVRISGQLRSSGAGVAWYYFQYSTDGQNWTTVDPTVYTFDSGVQVDHTEGIMCRDGSAYWPFEKTVVIEQEVQEGNYYFRLLVTTDVTQNGTSTPSTTGTARLARLLSVEEL